MTVKPQISRRAALAGAAGALASSCVFAKTATSARAAAPMLGPSPLGFYRAELGGFEITTVNDGAIQLKGPHPIFGQNIVETEVQDLAAANLLPRNQMEINFTPVIINTGKELVLFDAGNGAARRPGAGRLAAMLKTVGYSADQVDVVVLTHFHPDHIGGLMEDGKPLFANARYVTNQTEYDFWTADDRMTGGTVRVAKLTASNVKPLAGKFTFLKDGEDVTGGITAVAADGHTPGHTAFHIESKGERLLVGGDFCNHYVLSLQRPDWHVRFDMDKEKAAATRKKLLGMLAADKIPFTAYHMPFPAIGYVEKAGSSFRYVPASYQLNL